MLWIFTGCQKNSFGFKLTFKNTHLRRMSHCGRSLKVSGCLVYVPLYNFIYMMIGWDEIQCVHAAKLSVSVYIPSQSQRLAYC